ncbi:MAG TPA: hypothetical protein VE487_08360 [Ilumatobacter sp.]|nr:hypothetical protein [Ilumatobacter sp.]
MGPPPIPPHERTWRHPSEVAAAERHAIRHTVVQRSTRSFAIATGSVGLVAVAILMVMMTPPAQDSPVAVSATTSPSPPFSTTPSTPAEASGRATAPVAARAIPRALATPIGDGRLALMTAPGSSIRRGAQLDVQLTNGPVVTAVVNATAAGVVVVSIASVADGHEIAAGQPDADEIVTVLAEPPVTIAFAALTMLHAEEGTPVLDGDGELIGLCSQRHGAGDDQPITLIDVTGHPSLDEQRAVATTTAP